MSMNFNDKQFQARIFWGLKSRTGDEDTLPPRFLEIAICEAFGYKHVGDGNFYADGILGDTQMSIKTRQLKPIRPKIKQGKDFHSDPGKFLGPIHNAKQDKWTYGLEIVQRRQGLDFDDVNEPAEKIGLATLDGFLRNVTESHNKYSTKFSQEVISVHGWDHTGMYYLLSLYWKEYQHFDLNRISWCKEGNGVSGYITENGINYKLVERVNGNSKREGTCFKEYKNVLNWTNTAKIKIPKPESWQFNQAAILAEIDLKEKSHASLLLKT